MKKTKSTATLNEAAASNAPEGAKKLKFYNWESVYNQIHHS